MKACYLSSHWVQVIRHMYWCNAHTYTVDLLSKMFLRHSWLYTAYTCLINLLNLHIESQSAHQYLVEDFPFCHIVLLIQHKCMKLRFFTGYVKLYWNNHFVYCLGISRYWGKPGSRRRILSGVWLDLSFLPNNRSQWDLLSLISMMLQCHTIQMRNAIFPLKWESLRNFLATEDACAFKNSFHISPSRLSDEGFRYYI